MRTVFVLSGGGSLGAVQVGMLRALAAPPRSAIATAVHALTLLIEQRLIFDVAAYAAQAELIVLPPLCPLSVASVDFRFGAPLIERAETATGEWLAAGNHRLPHPRTLPVTPPSRKTRGARATRRGDDVRDALTTRAATQRFPVAQNPP
jgi:hypothetical protein